MTSKREHSWEISICMWDKVGRGVFRILFFKGRNLSKILITRLCLSGSDGKGSACSTGDLCLIPVYWEISRRSLLEKEIATHPSILAWRIPQTEGPDGIQFMGSQRVGCNLHFPFHLGSPNIAWTWFLICFINAKLFNFSFYPFFLNDIACKCSITTTCFPDHDLKKFLIFRLYIFLLKLWQVANCKLQSKHWNCLHKYFWEWCHSPDHACCFPRITKEQGNSHVPLMNTWRISSWVAYGCCYSFSFSCHQGCCRRPKN